MQVGALLDSFAQAASREALSATGGLHVGLVVVAVAAQHHRQAGHALTTDEADFDGMFAISIGHDRGEPAVGKVDGFDRPTTPLQHFKERQIGGLQMRFEQLKVSADRRDRMRFLWEGPLAMALLPLGARALGISQPSAP